MTVYFLAMTALRAPVVVSHTAFLRTRGVPSVVVTTERLPFDVAGLDAGVEVLELVEAERRALLWAAEQALVYRLPGAVATGIAKFSSGGAARPTTVERLQLKASNVFHHSVFLRAYKVVRPYLLWRVARREVLPRLSFAADDEVVVVDSQAIPLAWRLARQHPDTKVSFALDRAEYDPEGPARGDAAQV